MAEKLNRERILSHIQGDEDYRVLNRVLDSVQLVLRDHEARVTDFLDPYHAMLAEGILPAIGGISFAAHGGYQGAERKRIAVTPAYTEPGWEDFHLALGLVKARGGEELKHRDYLGAMLGTGLRREKVGDLLVFEGRCQFVVDNGIYSYLEMNWQQVGRSTVTVSPLSAEQWQQPPEEGEVLRISVSSLRLDAVAAQGFDLARGKLAEAVKGEKLRLNWSPVRNPSCLVKEGDMISFKGQGRILLVAVQGQSRKGRILLEVLRFR